MDRYPYILCTLLLDKRILVQNKSSLRISLHILYISHLHLSDLLFNVRVNFVSRFGLWILV